jgi:hypothetical protein
MCSGLNQSSFAGRRDRLSAARFQCPQISAKRNKSAAISCKRFRGLTVHAAGAARTRLHGDWVAGVGVRAAGRAADGGVCRSRQNDRSTQGWCVTLGIARASIRRRADVVTGTAPGRKGADRRRDEISAPLTGTAWYFITGACRPRSGRPPTRGARPRKGPC